MGTRLLPGANFRCDGRTPAKAQNPPALGHGGASKKAPPSRKEREKDGAPIFCSCGKVGPAPAPPLRLRIYGTAEEVAEKVVEGAKSSPQSPRRGHIFNDLAARLKSGPSQNLRESEFSAACEAVPSQQQQCLKALILRQFRHR